jgi:transcriptional regulator with XRE-family HTH domain
MATKKKDTGSLASRLKEARTEKGISQQELGEQAEVHYTNIGRYERGDAVPSAGVLNRIAGVLEVSGDYLMNGTLNNKATDSLKDEKLLNQFRRIEQMPEDKKQLLIEFLDGFILKSTLQKQLVH